MQFIKSDINLNFLGARTFAFILSISVIILSIGSLIVHKGPKYGVDFAGGTSIQIKFEGSVQIKDIKTGLTSINLEKPSVQSFGTSDDNEFQIRTNKSFMKDPEFVENLKSTLTEATGTPVIDVSLDMVGPQVSKDLRKKALMAMFFALLFIAIYISGRFEFKWMMSGLMAAVLGGGVYFINSLGLNAGMPALILIALCISLIFCWFMELKFAMGAIVALIHDITITVGIFSLMNIEFTLPIIAALLTIIGYSLNDTIIVFDRIRENSKKLVKEPLEFVINKSINETLSRTILTSITTLMVVVTLFFFGGGVIHHFALAMIIGVFVGTYSSIFVASPILLAWQNKDN